MKKLSVLLLLASIFAGLFVLLKNKSDRIPLARTSQQSELPPALSQSSPTHRDSDTVLPDSRSTAEDPTGSTQERDASAQAALQALPEAEQASLWSAFSEARREAHPIAEHRRNLPENQGFDYYASNPKNKLQIRYGAQGVRIDLSTQDPEEQAGFHLRLLAVAGEEVSYASKPAKSTEEKTRMEYQHTAELSEWYRNKKEGLEQGYTLSKRPKAAGDKVTLRVGVDGLVASASKRGNPDLIALKKNNETVFHYSKLVVYDANGVILPSEMRPTHGGGIELAYRDTGAKYPVTVDPLITTREAKLSRRDTAIGHNFGRSVALSGETALIGAEGDDHGGANSGSAYVFTRTGSSWTQQAKLTADDAAIADYFGRSVALSGETALIGAEGDNSDDDGMFYSGSAYVFTRTGSSWTQQAKLTARDAEAYDYFGSSVAISGETALIGAEGDDDDGMFYSGSAYVFTRDGSSWNQQAKLTADNAEAYDYFGVSVALSGETALIGAYLDDDGGSASGSAYVFTRTGRSWAQQAKLTASDAAAGDSFGFSVALSGETALIGAFFDDDDGGFSSGSAYVFTRSGSSWTQQAKLTARDAEAGDRFGRSVALSGETALIGSESDVDGVFSSGSAYVFTRSGSSWTQQAKLTADDAATGDHFGLSVALSGETALIGAYGGDDGGSDSGSAYVFTRTGRSWTQQQKLTADDAVAGDAESDDLFGSAVALSGNTALIGARDDDDGGFNSGSAYVFTRTGRTWNQQAKLTASDAARGDSFGKAVALSGETALIGAYGGAHSGSAYVFTRSGRTWTQQAKLTARDAAVGYNFGHAVALSGNTALIGAYRDDDGGADSGSAYVFTRSSSTWMQQAKLTADDAAAYDNFGYSVALSEETALIGAYRDDDVMADSGSAYVFTRTGRSWTQQAKLTADDAAAYDNFGLSVALSGESALIGAYRDDDVMADSGSAYVFMRSGSTWTQQAKLTASDAGTNDDFGFSVALSGETALIGAPGNDFRKGSVYVFTRSESSESGWSEPQELTAENFASPKDSFGTAVALSGNTALIGASGDSGGSGSVYLFRIVNSGVADLVVYDHLNNQLLSGDSATPFSGAIYGSSTSYPFRLHNAGTLDLDISTISLSGADVGQFSLTVPDLSSSRDLAPSGSLTYTIAFTPTGTISGEQVATLLISSNDPDEGTFVFHLSGLALSATADVDNDGMTDWAEYSNAPLGFDWQSTQTGLVNHYFDNAQHSGLYTTSEMAAVSGAVSVAEVDSATRRARLVIGLKESTSLSGFTPISIHADDISVNDDGDLEVDLAAPAGKRFIQAVWE